jgi:hypothetical protein
MPALPEVTVPVMLWVDVDESDGFDGFDGLDGLVGVVVPPPAPHPVNMITDPKRRANIEKISLSIFMAHTLPDPPGLSSSFRRLCYVIFLVVYIFFVIHLFNPEYK